MRRSNRPLLTLVFASALLLAGCAGEVGVIRVGAEGRAEYGNDVTAGGITQNTCNLLGNFLLEECYNERPLELIGELEKLFRAEPHPEYLAALADCAWNLGLREQGDPDLSVRFHLSAALYSYGYLSAMDRPERNPYHSDRLLMMRIYNGAIAEIFDYLHERGLHRKSSFSLNTADGRRIPFLAPCFELPLSPDCFSDFLLCADFRTKNLTHVSRSFGIGAPLICQLSEEAIGAESEERIRFAQQQTLPGTLMIHFGNDEGGQLTAHLAFLDSRNQETAKIGCHSLPLELDFSTPLAYMARNPLPFDYLTYMIRPEATRRMQGLYMLEPFREDRIPVVLVHGLLSNIRTWMQMINTLQSDPVLRKYYQFWGFTYSSGNPVLYSAKMLRDELRFEAERLKASGRSSVMFSRMVLVGHSMGGLVSKAMVVNSGENLAAPLFGENSGEILRNLTQEQRAFLDEMFSFEALPFVKRVVFLAVPHRGSDFARSWIGKLGSRMVELPVSLITRGEGIIRTLMNQGIFLPNDAEFATGIDNLDPENKALKLLDVLPFAQGVVFHSIIGSRDGDSVPGGSDGIVPYLSSHLDGAESELVVRSGHSVQDNPLAIQELRRILMEHLRQFPELKVELPTFPDSVGNSMNRAAP